MRLPRLTIRTMMALIALAAVLLATEKARRDWVFCRHEVLVYAEFEASYLRLAAEDDRAAAEAHERYERYQAQTDPLSEILAANRKEKWAEFAADAKYCRETATRAARRRAQYERAMVRPWESIPPELP
jgi:hypothetical protein